MHECMEESYTTAYNLGCGSKKWPGWIGVDLYSDKADMKCDLRKLDIASDSADAVAAIHVLEHFHSWEAGEVILEWKRILKPGGKMILEVPSLDKIMAYVCGCFARGLVAQDFMFMHALYGNQSGNRLEMCHKWNYTEVMLGGLLESAGMKGVTFKHPNYHFSIRDMRVECLK